MKISFLINLLHLFGYNPHPLCCFNIIVEYFYLYIYYIDKSIGKLNIVCLDAAKTKYKRTFNESTCFSKEDV